MRLGLRLIGLVFSVPWALLYYLRLLGLYLRARSFRAGGEQRRLRGDYIGWECARNIMSMRLSTPAQRFILAGAADMHYWKTGLDVLRASFEKGVYPPVMLQLGAPPDLLSAVIDAALAPHDDINARLYICFCLVTGETASMTGLAAFRFLGSECNCDRCNQFLLWLHRNLDHSEILSNLPEPAGNDCWSTLPN